MNGRSLVLCIVLLVILASAQAMAVTLGISSDGKFFTIDGVPTYLNGISYYGGTQISTPSMVTQDLDDMVARGINWIRDWCYWSQSIYVTDANGNVREPYMSRLKTIITEANNRGMIVDVTMSRGAPAPSNVAQHIACAQTIATHLLPYRNVYIDIANERDVGDTRYVSYPEMAQIIAAIKAIDPDRICTGSGTPTDQNDLNNYITSGCDFIATHLCRDSGCASQTYGTVKSFVTWMTALGKRIPVHLQEPFRRGYQSYQPVQEDYYRDDSGAKAAEAAGWCLHNGDQDGGYPYRSFRMSDATGRLFAQLDSVEQDVTSNMSDAVGGASWKVRRYQAEYSEQMTHSVGRKEGLYWSANILQDSAGYMTWGQYLNGIPTGHYRAAWRLMIDDNTSNNDTVATIDIFSVPSVIAQRVIHRQDFTAANTWQTFIVEWNGTGQTGLQFRTRYHDNCYLKVDHITFSSDPAPDIVTGLAGVGTDGQVALSWINPVTANYAGTMVRYKTTGYPTSQTDGTPLCDRTAAPGSSDGFVHSGITGALYYYAAYAHDSSGNYSPAAYASGSPHSLTNTVYDNGGNPWSIPGLIEAEHYDNGGEGIAYHTIVGSEGTHVFRPSETVYTEATGDTGGGYNIGSIDAGEWWEYTVNVGSAGFYSMQMRVASPNTSGQFRIEVDGTDVTGACAIPNTGGWQTYGTVQLPGVTLASGDHIIRVYVVAAGWNFNYLNVVSSTCFSPSITSQPTAESGCAGTSAGFDLGATGTGLSYQWRKNGANISNGATGNGSTYVGCTTGSLTITNAQMGDSTTGPNGFDCVVSGSCGAVTSNRVSLAVNNCQTVTIQRGTYGNVRDTVLSGDPDKVDTNCGACGGDVRLYPDTNYASGKGPRHLLIGFDVSGIPAGSTIVSATLGLYFTNNGPTITGYRLSRLRSGRDWVEGAGGQSPASINEPTWNCRKAGSPTPASCNAAWGTLGATNTSSDIDDTTSQVWDQINGTADSYKTFDVTGWVNDWVNNSATWPNNGILTWGGSAPTTSNVYWRVATSDDTGLGPNPALYRPYLIVSYMTPCDPPSITGQPASMVKPSGAGASFTVSATGTGLTYQWKKGAGNIGGATSASYSIGSISSTDAGDYSCTVTGTCGSLSSDAATLTVLADNGSIATAKGLANGAPVQLGNKDLYENWSGFAYLEEPTLFSGVRVQGSLTASAGDRICLIGTMQKPVGAEPYVQVTTMTAVGAATAGPVGANNAALVRNLMDGIYVTAWGTVAQGSMTANSYIMTDGGAPIRVITQGAPGVGEGDFVVVAGAAGYDGGRVIYKK